MSNSIIVADSSQNLLPNNTYWQTTLVGYQEARRCYTLEPHTCVFNAEFCLYGPYVAAIAAGAVGHSYHAPLLPPRAPVVLPHSVSFIKHEVCPTIRSHLSDTNRGRGKGWPLKLLTKELLHCAAYACSHLSHNVLHCSSQKLLPNATLLLHAPVYRHLQSWGVVAYFVMTVYAYIFHSQPHPCPMFNSNLQYGKMCERPGTLYRVCDARGKFDLSMCELDQDQETELLIQHSVYRLVPVNQLQPPVSYSFCLCSRVNWSGSQRHNYLLKYLALFPYQCLSMVLLVCIAPLQAS